MITCTRKIEFDAAHRIVNHESKCKYLHGHRYVIEATFTAPELDTLGRLIDFGVIKEKLGQWIDSNWDHTTILCNEDSTLGRTIADHTGQRIFYLANNPTAENMAAYLLNDVCLQIFSGSLFECIKLRLYETPNCYVEVSLSNF